MTSRSRRDGCTAELGTEAATSPRRFIVEMQARQAV
jgi:hypothetical protein